MRFLRILFFTICVISCCPSLANQNNLEQNLRELDTNGFTVVQDVFTSEQLQQLAAQYEHAKTKALAIVNTQPATARKFSENDQQNESVYWKTDKELILRAGRGRYDLFQGFGEGVFAEPMVMRNPKLESLMQNIMHAEYTDYVGVIWSQSGSEDQYWHRDAHTLANDGTDGAKLVTMDDFYFTILVPLTVPFTKENGTTEFIVGSHRLPASKFTQCRTAQTDVPLGAAIVFNGKINHRGKANLSKVDRPALYIVYHKKWYNDQYRNGIN